MNKYLLVVVSILVFLAVSISVSTYIITGFDFIFNPEPINMDLVNNDRIEFDLELSRSCVHQIGIGFKEKSENSGSIHKVIGRSIRKLNFPAKIDLHIVGSNGDVLENKGLKEKWLGYNFDGSNAMFITEITRLPEGVYRVIINIHQTSDGLESLDSYFFASHLPKFRCN